MEDLGKEGDVDPGLLSAADDIIRAVGAKDSEALARALQAAFEMCGSGQMVAELPDIF